MRENSNLTVRFEDLISDYTYFKKNLLEIIDLEIDYKTWEKYVSTKVNTNKNIEIATEFDEWSCDQKKFFAV